MGATPHRCRHGEIVEAVLAELRQEVQEAKHREPRAPQDGFVGVLHVHHAEHEDELVEHKVPEHVLDVLLFRHPQLPKHHVLDGDAHPNQDAVGHVDQRLGGEEFFFLKSKKK